MLCQEARTACCCSCAARARRMWEMPFLSCGVWRKMKIRTGEMRPAARQQTNEAAETVAPARTSKTE